MSAKPSAGALDGLRVVELAHERIAFAGKLLADMGAEVIVVEPPGGAAARRYEPFLEDQPGTERSLYWWCYNTSKRSVTLDLEDEKGRELFLRLVATADLVIESEIPGRLDGLGLDYPQLRQVNEDLIMVSMTPFGRSGPGATAPATDLTMLAGGGPAWMCGYSDHSVPPVRGGGNQGYHLGCHYAVLAALTAVLVRDKTGTGQYCDVNMHAAANVNTEHGSYGWLVAGETVKRQTGRHAYSVPTASTQVCCADGRWVNTGVPPRTAGEFGILRNWILELDLTEEFPEVLFLEMGQQREFLDISAIGKDDEVTAIYSAARDAINLIAGKLSAYEFFIGAQSRGLSVGVIYSPEEVLEDEHFRARGFPTTVFHEDIGRSITYPGAPYRFSGTPWRISNRAPHVGEHNESVFGALGVDPRELARWRGTGDG